MQLPSRWLSLSKPSPRDPFDWLRDLVGLRSRFRFSRRTAAYTKCMSEADTTMRVPVELRDRIRRAASQRGLKQSALVELALRELEQAEFLRSVAAVQWDEAARDEADDWDAADLAESTDPWAPRQ